MNLGEKLENLRVHDRAVLLTPIPGRIMALMLDGSSMSEAHVCSYIGYLTHTRHYVTSTAVVRPKICSDLFRST